MHCTESSWQHQQNVRPGHSQYELSLFTVKYMVHEVHIRSKQSVNCLPRDASAERGDEIACRLSVRLSVCNVQVPCSNRSVCLHVTVHLSECCWGTARYSQGLPQLQTAIARPLRLWIGLEIGLGIGLGLEVQLWWPLAIADPNQVVRSAIVYLSNGYASCSMLLKCWSLHPRQLVSFHL